MTRAGPTRRHAFRINVDGEISMNAPETDAVRRDRAALSALIRILYDEDPIAIIVSGSYDEYEPEALTILPRLWACSSVDDVRSVVHEEFVTWFGQSTAGPP